jgi:hypothetical protein
VQRPVDRHPLVDAVAVLAAGVVPARLELLERQLVRPVAVHLVRRHEDERRFGAPRPCRLEEVERPDRVDLEVDERPLGRKVVRGLGGGVDDRAGTQLPDQLGDPVPLADVELVMRETRRGALNPGERFPRIACGTEEVGAHVVVDSVDGPSRVGEMKDGLRADEAARAGHEGDAAHGAGA